MFALFFHWILKEKTAVIISVNLTYSGLLLVEHSSKQAETQDVRLQKSFFLRNLLYFELGSTYNNPIYVKLTEIISAFSRTLKIWATISVSRDIRPQSCKDNYASDLRTPPHIKRDEIALFLTAHTYCQCPGGDAPPFPSDFARRGWSSLGVRGRFGRRSGGQSQSVHGWLVDRYGRDIQRALGLWFPEKRFLKHIFFTF